MEYSGRSSEPQWVKPKPFRCDYARFGKTASAPAEPDQTIAATNDPMSAVGTKRTNALRRREVRQ